MESNANPTTSIPVTAPDLKDTDNPSAKLELAACVVLTLALTDMFMPTYPAAPEKKAPIKKPTAELKPKISHIKIKIITPTMPIVIY